MSSSTRRLRAFKRWMSSNAVNLTPTLTILESPLNGSISVTCTTNLSKGTTVAKIPKLACLTVNTSGAAELIKEAQLDGILGLAVAIMFERSLGSESPWAGYLQLLPYKEELPLVWSAKEVDELLVGTELHQTVKQDKGLIYEDWKENIRPLIREYDIDPNHFGLEDYFAAKSLIASRSFQIDDYHGCGMVPVADLFNHKTGAEDVHFTSALLSDESENSETDETDDENESDEDSQTQIPLLQESGSSGTFPDKSSIDDPDSESSHGTPDDPMVLEMILVKDVKAGAEVFNTYGCVGNAALLHRYGFTEVDNIYDIVNIDLEVALQWSKSIFSGRHCRSRQSLWRTLGYSGCFSQNSEYFEISFDGEPQLELLILVYIFLLTDNEYAKLDLKLSTGNTTESPSAELCGKENILLGDTSKLSCDMLLTEDVCKALISLADLRESLYGESSLENDIETLKECNCDTDRKLYHSLVLRVSERKIVHKLRSYAEKSVKSLEGVHLRKKLKC